MAGNLSTSSSVDAPPPAPAPPPPPTSDPKPYGVAWDDKLLTNPHVVDDKRARVRRMFAAIAPSYDLNNHLHSLYIDQYWRRQAVRMADLKATDQVVDVACGTGDLTLMFAALLGLLNIKEKTFPRRSQVVGVDFTYEMLPIAMTKTDLFDDTVREQDPRVVDRWAGIVTYSTGDAQALPLPDASCDVVSIAFGIRNVQDPLAALREFRRVLRPGGRVVVLEFSVPTNPVIRWAYNMYCSKIMPWTATWISGDKSGAYKYLPHSVEKFLTREQMTEKLVAAGFKDVVARPLTFGAVVVYRGLVTG